MKRKIFSALLVFVLLCMPMLCFTGCGTDPSLDTHFVVSSKDITGTTIKVGTSLAALESSVLSVQIDYQKQQWHPANGEWQYVKVNSDNNDGSTAYDFAGTSPVWFYSGTATASTTALSMRDALTKGVSAKGWNTASAGERELTLTYGGISHTIKYKVTA